MKKNIFFLFFTYFLFFSSLEFSTRLIVYLSTNDKNIFYYGIKKNIFFHIIDLSEFSFNVTDYNRVSENNLHNTKEKKNYNQNKLIWVFGGSTSDVACVNQNTTSWPFELQNLNDKFIVKNFAKSGTNSDFAINTLINKIQKTSLQKPDIILWANYVNETDVLTFGFKNNKDLEKNIYINSNKNKFFYFIKSFSNSIENYSTFYKFFKKSLLALITYAEIPFKFDQRVFTEKEIELAAENYYLNTAKALNFSNKYGIEFYIVLLFDKSDLNLENKKNEVIMKYNIFTKTIQKLNSSNPKLRIINLKKINKNEIKNAENLFCDAIHYNQKGNKVVSNLIFKKF